MTLTQNLSIDKLLPPPQISKQLNRANLGHVNLKDAVVHERQLAAASSLDGATMPDGRLYDGDPVPWKVVE